MTILLIWAWCEICMESTPHEKMLDGSLRCTLEDHAENLYWHKERSEEKETKNDNP